MLCVILKNKTMGEHSSSKSLEIINFLQELGDCLDYYVDTEYPMSSNSFGGQAIDIAWFNDNSSKFPLFIFEIESTSNNSIANNPTKVFGKESKTFEKPLFFFHIIIDSADNSEKYNDLMGMFGKHNYEIFRINKGDLGKLIFKILSQHRRIRDNINLYSALRLLFIDKEINSKINIRDLLENIETIIHENQKIYVGHIYANIASLNLSFKDEYLNYIKQRFSNGSLTLLSYDDYCFNIVAEMINLGLIYSSFNNELEKINFKTHLEKYQNRYDIFKSIEYLPGINYDYDIFIHDYAPYYIALAFHLFSENLSAQKYLLDVEMEIIKKLPQNNKFVFEHHISWFLLMSASVDEFSNYFEEARKLSNANRKVLNTIVYCPLSKNDYQRLPESRLILIPDRKAYRKRMNSEFEHILSNDDISTIAIKSISKDWEIDLEYSFNLGVNLTNIIVKSNERSTTKNKKTNA